MMKGFCYRLPRIILLMSIVWLFPDTFQAQPTNVSGVINTYLEVKAVDTLTNRVILENPADASSLSLNDLVLIYQTQGAAIQSGVSNSSFGTITDVRGAGSFEMGRICSIDGGSVAIENKLLQTYYDTTVTDASIQLIIMPEYGDAEVTTSLSAPPWNGSTGGILAISVLDTFYVNGSIDVSELGFRGGEKVRDTFICNFLSSSTAYAYPSPYGATGVGARKGEGIAAFIPGQEYGRGPQANGGGGGNGHNTGGAGGGNGNAGGGGGQRVPDGFFECVGPNPGISGKNLAAFGYSAGQQRAFLGGGGGAGEKNNVPDCEDGGNGGGLILIIANVVTGSGSFLSDGGSVGSPCSDGNGGGGAGGSILINANTIDGAGLVFSAAGGDGGDTKINCEGPGGGGSGGVIWSSVPLGGAATLVTGGTSGIATDATCSNSAQGATAGGAGAVITAGLAPPQGLDPFPCVLQSSWPGFTEELSQKKTRFQVGLAQNPAPYPTLLLEGLVSDRDIRYQVVNIMGAIVASGEVTQEGETQENSIHLPGLPEGTYLIRVVHAGQESAFRFLLLR